MLYLIQVDLHVPAVPDNFERLRSDYMVELHLKVMQHQLEQVRALFVTLHDESVCSLTHWHLHRQSHH